MRRVEVPTPDGYRYLKIEDDEHFCKNCGWLGKDLDHTVCISNADDWYVCPQCGADTKYIDMGA